MRQCLFILGWMLAWLFILVGAGACVAAFWSAAPYRADVLVLYVRALSAGEWLGVVTIAAVLGLVTAAVKSPRPQRR